MLEIFYSRFDFKVTCIEFNSIKQQINSWLSISYTHKKRKTESEPEKRTEFLALLNETKNHTRNGISYVIVNFNVTIAFYVFNILKLRWIKESILIHTHRHREEEKMDYVNTKREYVSHKISKTLSLLQLMVYWMLNEMQTQKKDLNNTFLIRDSQANAIPIEGALTLFFSFFFSVSLCFARSLSLTRHGARCFLYKTVLLVGYVFSVVITLI